MKRAKDFFDGSLADGIEAIWNDLKSGAPSEAGKTGADSAKKE